MTNINWDSHVNTTVLRDGTSWGEPETMIEDKTRSGKQKRRMLHSMEKRTFNVVFNFTLEEYQYFRTWFTDVLKKGMYSFNFPQIDSIDKTVLKEYRIKTGGYPKYSNKTGQWINCTMIWEEV